MNQQQLSTLLKFIRTTSDDESDGLATTVLQMAADSITLDTLKALTSSGQPLPQVKETTANKKTPSKGEQENERKQNFGILNFTKQELSTMPKKFQKQFICDNRIVKYRYYQGLFQARYRRDGYNIEVASRDFETMKKKFIERLTGEAEQKVVLHTRVQKPPVKRILFGKYGEEWLATKKLTTKPSTYEEYERLFNTNLKPRFGNLYLTDIDRPMLQSYLFEFIEQGKYRTADKLKLQLNCIFDLAADDYGIPSPVKKIVLPYYESKKGTAFKKEEEKKLIDYCIENKDKATSSALLVLLYFGLRQSELSSLRIIDERYLECATSKERMGRNVVLRKIPFTPVFKRVLPYVDFEKAKTTNVNSIGTTVKRLFPNHHPHELRYTFITRCKECGVNPELVMLWDGHSFDKDVKTSEVDRGYTDYSEEYILSEAEKVDYKF